MPAPRMFSTTGSALTADEIVFAQQVAASFSLNMKRGWVKLVRRVDSLTGAIVEYHGDKNIAYVTPGGAVDYVQMLLPNPVPYRGVSIGVVDKGAPTARVISVTTVGNPNIEAATVTSIFEIRRANGVLAATITGTQQWSAPTPSGQVITHTNFPEPGYDVGRAVATVANGYYSSIYPVTDAVVRTPISTYPPYVAASEADIASDTGGKKTYVMASDGEVLASLSNGVIVPTPVGFEGALFINQYYSGGEIINAVFGNGLWSGGGIVRYGRVFQYSSPPNNMTYRHDGDSPFTVPEDCIYPIPAVSANFPGDPYNLLPPTTPNEVQWNTDWAAGVAAFNLRKKAWLKKNSDEFIAALKTGFAVGATGVTRPELQLGRLPEPWEFQIKRDVDDQYDSYTPTNTVGRKTKRDILYSEIAYSETVTSDTSANLTQAGVKVTTRSATLQYSFGGVVRETTINGSLTQTVTRHNNSSGTQVGLSRQENYSMWYEQTPLVVSSGVMTTTAPPYLADRTISRFGSVLNGSIQLGYNADSTIGAPGGPLAYANYTPPFPVASSNMEAVAPAWIEEWHRDSKVVYLRDGIGASNTQNDSALHGVTKIELTPVGLIANGIGTAAAGESVGIFSAAEDGTQVEIYGTAVYNFDWQTGELTFANWKALHGDNGLEVGSKIVDLPQGVLWGDDPINCLVTYRGLHWPDVVAAIRTRDGSLPTSTVDFDRVLYTLINAVKAG